MKSVARGWQFFMHPGPAPGAAGNAAPGRGLHRSEFVVLRDRSLERLKAVLKTKQGFAITYAASRTACVADGGKVPEDITRWAIVYSLGILGGKPVTVPMFNKSFLPPAWPGSIFRLRAFRTAASVSFPMDTKQHAAGYYCARDSREGEQNSERPRSASASSSTTATRGDSSVVTTVGVLVAALKEPKRP